MDEQNKQPEQNKPEKKLSRTTLTFYIVGLFSVAIALILIFVALNVLVLALVAALSSIMPAGWASLLVGVVLLAVAGLLALKGLNSLKPENIAPSRTVANVQADAQTIKENVSNGNHKH